MNELPVADRGVERPGHVSWRKAPHPQPDTTRNTRGPSADPFLFQGVIRSDEPVSAPEAPGRPLS